MSLEFNEISDVLYLIEACCYSVGVYRIAPCTTLTKCVMRDVDCNKCPYWKNKVIITPDTHTKEQISQLILDMRDAALLIYTLEN